MIGHYYLVVWVMSYALAIGLGVRLLSPPKKTAVKGFVRCWPNTIFFTLVACLAMHIALSSPAHVVAAMYHAPNLACWGETCIGFDGYTPSTFDASSARATIVVAIFLSLPLYLATIGSINVLPLLMAGLRGAARPRDIFENIRRRCNEAEGALSLALPLQCDDNTEQLTTLGFSTPKSELEPKVKVTPASPGAALDAVVVPAMPSTVTARHDVPVRQSFDVKVKLDRPAYILGGTRGEMSLDEKIELAQSGVPFYVDEITPDNSLQPGDLPPDTSVHKLTTDTPNNIIVKRDGEVIGPNKVGEWVVLKNTPLIVAQFVIETTNCYEAREKRDFPDLATVFERKAIQPAARSLSEAEGKKEAAVEDPAFERTVMPFISAKTCPSLPKKERNEQLELALSGAPIYIGEANPTNSALPENVPQFSHIVITSKKPTAKAQYGLCPGGVKYWVVFKHNKKYVRDLFGKSAE